MPLQTKLSRSESFLQLCACVCVHARVHVCVSVCIQRGEGEGSKGNKTISSTRHFTEAFSASPSHDRGLGSGSETQEFRQVSGVEEKQDAYFKSGEHLPLALGVTPLSHANPP